MRWPTEDKRVVYKQPPLTKLGDGHSDSSPAPPPRSHQPQPGRIDTIMFMLMERVSSPYFSPSTVDAFYQAAGEAISWAIHRARPKTTGYVNIALFDELLDRVAELTVEFSPASDQLEFPTPERLHSVNPAANPPSPFLGFYIINSFVDGFIVSERPNGSCRLVLTISECKF